jgi:DNA-binding MarR family transcriptional regulator
MHAILNSFSRDVTRLFDHYLKEFKLATPFVELLIHLQKEKKLSQKELSERMNLAPSTITRFINKLKKRGLVEKRMNGRMAYITLSEKGKTLIPSLAGAYQKAEETLQNKLGEKFVHTTEQLLIHGSEQLKRNI